MLLLGTYNNHLSGQCVSPAALVLSCNVPMQLVSYHTYIHTYIHVGIVHFREVTLGSSNYLEAR